MKQSFLQRLLLRLIGLGLLSIAGIGCTHSLHVSHISDFSPTFKKYTEGKLIKAKSEQFVIMHFTTQTNYVEIAYNQLQKQCQNGQIQGITTQYSTSHGFFSWTNYIEMQGLCIL